MNKASVLTCDSRSYRLHHTSSLSLKTVVSSLCLTDGEVPAHFRHLLTGVLFTLSRSRKKETTQNKIIAFTFLKHR